MFSSADELSPQNGKYPPGTDVTTSSPPKVVKTGVSSSYTLNAKEEQLTSKEPSNSDEDSKVKWYVLRVRYNNDKKAYNELQKEMEEVFFATRHVTRLIHGKRKKVVVPMLPGLLFVKASRNDILKFRHSSSPMAIYVRFYRNRTEPKSDFGKNPPVTVKDTVMMSFINICKADNIHSRILTEEQRKKIVPGTHVRVIDGFFKGVEGNIIKVNRQRCVLVDIKNVCSIHTAYVPKACLEEVAE